MEYFIKPMPQALIMLQLLQHQSVLQVAAVPPSCQKYNVIRVRSIVLVNYCPWGGTREQPSATQLEGSNAELLSSDSLPIATTFNSPTQLRRLHIQRPQILPSFSSPRQHRRILAINYDLYK